MTEEIALAPFTLHECEEYAESRGLSYSRRMVMEAYMALGGVPYYWRMLRRGMSPAQDFDELFFGPVGRLRREFDELYASLFKRKEPYVAIVTALGLKEVGLTRDELVAASGLADGGRFGRYLEELEECGFIRRFQAIGMKTKGAIYQLMDPYTLFYLRFVGGRDSADNRQWTDRLETPEYYNWVGHAFEHVCLQHVRNIKRALEIGGVRTSEYAWRGTDDQGRKAQIDLLIDRNDGIVDICEMKYTREAYSLSEAEWERIAVRRKALRDSSSTRKAIHVVMVTDLPMVKNAWAKEVSGFVSSEDLFATD